VFSKTESIHIAVSPEVVYDYISDFARHPEWAHERLEIKVDDGGSSFDYVTHFMGTAAGKGEVTASDRPRSLTYECEDKDGRYRWTFDLQPEEGGTRLTHTVWRLKAPLYFTVLQPVLWRFVGKKMVSGGLENIKANLEGAAAKT
jgi:uncharacterized protein YndB with AHSA1/START domain